MTPVQQIFSSLVLISQTAAKKEKEAILRRLKDVPEAKKFTERATDPFGNYWLTVDPDVYADKFLGQADPELFAKRFQQFNNLCDQLRNRVITGGAAERAVAGFLSSCSNVAPYQEGSWYIAALNKHLNIGVANSAIGAVWPDLVSDFAVPLAESLYEQTTGKRNDDIFAKIQLPITIEPKLDGANGSLVYATDEKGGVFSRAEGQWPALMRWQRAFKQAVKNIGARVGKDLTGWVLNGEFKASMHKEDPKNWNSSWGKTTALIRAGIKAGNYSDENISEYGRKCLDRGDLYFVAYDTYPYKAYASGEWSVIYGHKSMPNTRSAMCASIVAEMKRVDPTLPVQHVEQYRCNTWEEIEAWHERFLDEQHEGSMIKQDKPCVLDRTANIVKYKKYTYRDAIVIGVNEGTNSNKGKAGTFAVYYPDTDEVGKVTVRTNALKDWVWKYKDSIAGFKIESAEQYDKLKVSKARNPTLVRPRVDVAPHPIEEVAEICRRFNLPEPKNIQMSAVNFRQAIGSFEL